MRKQIWRCIVRLDPRYFPYAPNWKEWFVNEPRSTKLTSTWRRGKEVRNLSSRSYVSQTIHINRAKKTLYMIRSGECTFESLLSDVARRTFVLRSNNTSSSSLDECVLRSMFEECERLKDESNALLVAGALEIARLRENVTLRTQCSSISLKYFENHYNTVPHEFENINRALYHFF